MYIYMYIGRNQHYSAWSPLGPCGPGPWAPLGPSRPPWAPGPLGLPWALVGWALVGPLSPGKLVTPR